MGRTRRPGLTAPGWLRRLFFCRAGWCPCVPYLDRDGRGGCCIRCGKVVGYRTRAELLRIADAAIARQNEPKIDG